MELCGDQGRACAQLASSYGAARTITWQGDPFTAEWAAQEHAEVVAWLYESREWSTPLHHLAIIDVGRARALLREGADLHAAAAVGSPTPLSRLSLSRAAPANTHHD